MHREEAARGVRAREERDQMNLQNGRLESDGLKALEAAGVIHVAGYVKDQKENLAAVALRYALWRAEVNSNEPFRLCTITGMSTISDLTENVGTAHKLLKPAEATPTSLASATLNNRQIDKDQPVFEKAQKMFGQWMSYSFTSLDRRWSTELKHMLQESEL
ncbi:hypothetical protein LTR12_012395 [Friedmanniomyces endolithicus]|nr:hypothetical protein LTR12_012395 [Friedmanniomyces endolithicus]